MTFLADEGLVENAPREGIEIQYGTTIHRIACGTRDADFNGNTFTRVSSEREAISDMVLKQDKDTSIRLPVSHEFVQRYNRNGIPPKVVTCSVYRKQINGDVKRIAFGELVSCKIDGHVASFLLVDAKARALKRSLPVYPVGKQCPYVLFDLACRASRAAFRVQTTVASHDGATVVVATMDAHPDHWAQRGEIVHVPSGERMTISEQVGTTLTLQLPIFDLADGDVVQVFAGCKKNPDDCANKFNNTVNYGGLPELPEGDVYLNARGGHGMYQSEPDA
jgi:hypothetical protein